MSQKRKIAILAKTQKRKNAKNAKTQKRKNAKMQNRNSSKNASVNSPLIVRKQFRIGNISKARARFNKAFAAVFDAKSWNTY